MHGRHVPQVTLLAFVDLEARVPGDHPLRTIKAVADQALEQLSPDLDRMYADVGRPSIPPERLLKSSLLIALFSVRSERAFCEQLDYNLLFRWFLDMQLMERSFDPTVFTKNRKRLLEHPVGQQRHLSIPPTNEPRRVGRALHPHCTSQRVPRARTLRRYSTTSGRCYDDGARQRRSTVEGAAAPSMNG